MRASHGETGVPEARWVVGSCLHSTRLGAVDRGSPRQDRRGQREGLAIMRPVWQRLGYVEGENLLLRNELRRLPGIIGELIDHGGGGVDRGWC